MVFLNAVDAVDGAAMVTLATYMTCDMGSSAISLRIKVLYLDLT